MSALRNVCLIAVAGWCALLPSRVWAQYPEKPLRWILTQPPGGANDILVRPIAQRLTDTLRQPVLVDNRSGAGGNIGAELAAKSPRDGYTLVTLSITHAVSATLYAKLNYDLLKDFSAVTLLATNPNVLVVHPAVPIKTVKELIALTKAQPGRVTYSSSGSGTPNHMAAELFSYMTGIKMVHVPYKGGGASVIGLLTGEASLSFASMPSAIGHIRAGKLKPIAVSTAERSAQMPELPTIGEAGVKGYEAETWFALYVPTGTSKDIVARLNAETVNILKAPDLVQQLATAGLQVRTSTPEEAAAYTQVEVDKWGKVVKASGMRAD